MNTKMLRLLLVFSPVILLTSFEIPIGWFKSGESLESYEVMIDKNSGQDGKNAASIKSTVDSAKGYASLAQTCLAEKFLVRRVRMTAYMKTKNVANKSGFWLRADKEGAEKAISFDNMYDRQVKGTNDWKKYEIVIDVPGHATSISYGAALIGSGQIWFDRFNFEIVDKSVPTTGTGNDYGLPLREPSNLDFEN